MGMKEDALEILTKAIIDIFEGVGSDISEIEEISRGFDLGDWRAYRMTQAAALAIPSITGLASYVTVPLELIALIRFLRNSALGTGFILNGAADPLDFPGIFGLEADKPHIDQAIVRQLRAKAQAMAGGVALTSLGPQVAAKLIASAITTQLAIMAHHTLSPLAAKKIAAMLAKFLLPAGATRWIPGIGAIISAGANAYVTHAIIDASVNYYGLVRQVHGR